MLGDGDCFFDMMQFVSGVADAFLGECNAGLFYDAIGLCCWNWRFELESCRDDVGVSAAFEKCKVVDQLCLFDVVAF